jgi:thioredoxin-like negative regulator of GroEL
VQALPTVFAVRGGRFTDSFTGMPPVEALQEFLMRLLMGLPTPAVDKAKNQYARTPEELAALSTKLAQMAGEGGGKGRGGLWSGGGIVMRTWE